jgi:hypothetical protein
MKTLLRWPMGMALAHSQHGASCGHFALAAAFGVDVPDVLRFFPPGQGWCSVRTMEDALTRSSRIWRPCPSVPKQGVMLVQGLGSWMKPKVPFAARLSRTHWVAVAPAETGAAIADVNGTHWIPRELWETTILHSVLVNWKATGWAVHRSYTV